MIEFFSSPEDLVRWHNMGFNLAAVLLFGGLVVGLIYLAIDVFWRKK